MKEGRRRRSPSPAGPAAAAKQRPAGRSPWGYGLLAALVPLVAYWPTLGYGFLLDDFVLFQTSASLSDLGSLLDGFRHDLGAVRIGSDEVISSYYRPIFLALSTLYFQLVGGAPGGWHFAAVLLAAWLGWVAYRLLARFGLPPLSALLASLVFSLHPAHAGSVAWASGLQELLAALFAFFAVRALQWRRAGDALPIVAAATCYALAVLSKEVAIVLPAFVAIWAFVALPPDDPGQTRRLRRATFVLGAVAALYLAARIAVLGGLAHPPATAPGFVASLPSVPVALATYLRLLFVPVGFSFFRPERPDAALNSAPVLLSVAFLLALAALVVWAFCTKRTIGSLPDGASRRSLLLPIGWIVLWLAPVLNLWALDPQWMVTDRYLLLPSLGLPWLLALVLPKRFTNRALALVAALFAVLTLRYSAIFADPQSFIAAMEIAEPTSATVFSEKGRLLLEAGRNTEARQALERAVALDPLAPRPLLSLGNLEMEQGELDGAEGHFRQALIQRPYASRPFKLLAIARAKAGQGEAAFRLIEEAARRWPDDFEVQLLDAIFRGVRSDRPGALAAFAAAGRLRPDDPALAGGFDAMFGRLRGTIEP